MPGRDSEKLLVRLADFADRFAGCFGTQKQRAMCRFYVTGILSKAERKSMEAMLGGRVPPAVYQRLQHFITHSTWDHKKAFSRLRAQIPTREGVVIIDDTGFPKAGPHSVAVQRQYCPPLGKVANCQVAVTTVLRAGNGTWPLGMELYVPDDWLDDEERRDRVGIPREVRSRTKWEISLGQIRRAMGEGFKIQAVVADAGYGDVSDLRTNLGRLGLRYVLRVGGRHVVKLDWAPIRGVKKFGRRVRSLAHNETKISLEKLAEALPAACFKSVTWGAGSKGPIRARAVRFRVTLAGERQVRRGRRNSKIWLLIERRGDGGHKFHFSNLPETCSLLDLLRVAHTRWPVEQGFQQMKEELGLDHFEGRTWTGWNHHVFLSWMAFTFLQLERHRARTSPRPTLPGVRAVLAELIAALVYAEQPSLRRLVERLARDPPGI